MSAHFFAIFESKRQDFAIRKCAVVMNVNAKCYQVICIFNPLVDYRL